MLNTLVKITALTGLLLSSSYADRSIKVKIINNTSASYFTPLLVTTHKHSHPLFRLGETASSSLQAMAEGGDISGLSSDLLDMDAMIVENPASGLLAPGKSTTATLKFNRHRKNSLSIVAMVLPTNDGFVALNNWKIPKKSGTYVVPMNVYDAGTEANNEIINGAGAPGALGIPADPGGHAGTGATGINTTAEGFVHVHRGTIGDLNATGGVSDLSQAYHGWLNPGATAIITVKYKKRRKHRRDDD